MSNTNSPALDVVRNLGHGVLIWHELRIANNKHVMVEAPMSTAHAYLPILLSQSVAKIKVTP